MKNINYDSDKYVVLENKINNKLYAVEREVCEKIIDNMQVNDQTSQKKLMVECIEFSLDEQSNTFYLTNVINCVDSNELRGVLIEVPL